MTKMPFRLTLAEQTSPVWVRIKQHFEERLESLRIQNDNPALNELETSAIRARIAECKYMTGLDKELPVQS